MQPRQSFRRAMFALTLAVSLLAPIAPLSRPAEAAGGPMSSGLAGGSVTVSQVDPASVRPGPGSISPSSVNPGASASGAGQPMAPPTPAVAPTGAGATKSDGAFQAETAPNGKRARAGSLIVKFRAGVQAAARDGAHRQVGSQSVEPVGDGKAVRVQVEPGMLAQAMSAYAARSDVERVEPDYLLFAHMTPSDPRYGEEWALPKIGAPTA
jgi:hypothetical protein